MEQHSQNQIVMVNDGSQCSSDQQLSASKVNLTSSVNNEESISAENVAARNERLWNKYCKTLPTRNYKNWAHRKIAK